MHLTTVKAQRLYLKVAEQINALVNSGEIKAGERLPAERVLAEKLGVSRPTVREAMIALEIAGVIDIKSGSGIYVSNKEIGLPLLDEGYGPFEILDARHIVETEACALAALNITVEQIQTLRNIVIEMQEEQKLKDASETADMKFHLIIAEAAKNSVINHIIRWLWDLRNQSRLSQIFNTRLRDVNIYPSIDEHLAIIDALEKGDPELSKQAMRNHIESATENAAAYFEKL